MTLAGDSMDHNGKDDSSGENPRPSIVQQLVADREYLRYAKAKKRLFVGLVMGTSILVSIFLVLLWIVPPQRM